MIIANSLLWVVDSGVHVAGDDRACTPAVSKGKARKRGKWTRGHQAVPWSGRYSYAGGVSVQRVELLIGQDVFCVCQALHAQLPRLGGDIENSKLGWEIHPVVKIWVGCRRVHSVYCVHSPHRVNVLQSPGSQQWLVGTCQLRNLTQC